MLPALILMGIGMGNIFPPAFQTATFGVDRADTGVASAMVNTMQQVGGSIGTALLSSIFASAVTSYADGRAAVARRSLEAATVHGYTVAFWVAAGVFAVGAVVVGSVVPSIRLAGARRRGAGHRALAVTRAGRRLLARARQPAARRSWSRWTRRCSVGGRRTSTSARCRSRAEKGSRSTLTDPRFRELVRERLAAGVSSASTGRPTLAAVKALLTMTRKFPGSFATTCARRSRAPRWRRSSRPIRARRLTWEDIATLRDRTDLPVLLKGVLHPDDARRAADMGLDGLVVSNHGGRQISSPTPTRARAIPSSPASDATRGHPRQRQHSSRSSAMTRSGWRGGRATAACWHL